jgi:hypothetical protein
MACCGACETGRNTKFIMFICHTDLVRAAQEPEALCGSQLAVFGVFDAQRYILAFLLGQRRGVSLIA